MSFSLPPVAALPVISNVHISFFLFCRWADLIFCNEEYKYPLLLSHFGKIDKQVGLSVCGWKCGTSKVFSRYDIPSKGINGIYLKMDE